MTVTLTPNYDCSFAVIDAVVNPEDVQPYGRHRNVPSYAVDVTEGRRNPGVNPPPPDVWVMECVRCGKKHRAKDPASARSKVCAHYIDAHIPDESDKEFTKWLKSGRDKNKEDKSAMYEERLDYEAMGIPRPLHPPPLGVGEVVVEGGEGLALLRAAASVVGPHPLSRPPHLTTFPRFTGPPLSSSTLAVGTTPS